MKEFKVAIIGGGSAGMIAAIAASKNSKNSIILLEKTDSLGKKLLLTGGGRCNITNSSSIKEHLKLINNKNFLKHSFYSFSNEDLLELFKKKGLDFKEEKNNRIFPKTNDSRSVLNILKEYLNELNVKINLKFEVSKITKENNHFIINNSIKVSKIILSTGGITYPQTGSSGDGYKIAKNFNHTITNIKHGLVPLIVKDKYLNELSGITLENIEVSYGKYSSTKEVLISHFGISGPGILDISNKIVENIDYNILEKNKAIFKNIFIKIDFYPKMTLENLNIKIINDISLNGKTKIKNYLKNYLPNKFIDFFLKKTEINGDKTLSNIGKKDKNKIINNLKEFKIEVKGIYKDLSKITIGGIAIKDINPKTMESKIIKNLYFAGEILEPYSISGGYNLQIAFSTAYLAGESTK
ncbi:MAG: NAD(P)/FAD-dependent oxidoreductase [Methanobacteriaceae archaeon]|jgi:hypothetical protein|nr:NAD(P)/FAD-dependent oxidoreductase [Methanobacteriaceae archaeon]